MNKKIHTVNLDSNKIVSTSDSDIIINNDSDSIFNIGDFETSFNNIDINVDGEVKINNVNRIIPNPITNRQKQNLIKIDSTFKNTEFMSLEGSVIQTQFFNYRDVFSSSGNGWRETPLEISITPIRPNSKILLTTTFHYGVYHDGRWWGGRLYRKIGSENYSELLEANNMSQNTLRRCFISSNWGMDSDQLYDEYIKNVNAKYIDIPNTTKKVSYKIYINARTGNSSDGTQFFINRVATDYDSDSPIPVSFMKLQEIYVDEDVSNAIVTEYTISNQSYKVFTYLESGTFIIDQDTEVDFLVVGGGGGGSGGASGSNEGGGGGAGGLIYQEGITFKAGTYTITVGEGGVEASNGEDSIISNMALAYGGGGGGLELDNSLYNDNGNSGGSGGGGRHQNGLGGQPFGGILYYNRNIKVTENFPGGPNHTGIFGNRGGNSIYIAGEEVLGAGGGGAGLRGGDSVETSGVSSDSDYIVGVGGNGKSYTIRDGVTAIYYAGGGGGSRSIIGVGGLGGGGDGSDNLEIIGQSGENNTGGGGGGTYSGDPEVGSSNGGSGIVIIRYKI